MGFGKIDVRGDNFDTSGDKCHLNCGLKKKRFSFHDFNLRKWPKRNAGIYSHAEKEKTCGKCTLIAFEFWHPLFGFFSFQAEICSYILNGALLANFQSDVLKPHI